jgi:hypothetical protein
MPAVMARGLPDRVPVGTGIKCDKRMLAGLQLSYVGLSRISRVLMPAVMARGLPVQQTFDERCTRMSACMQHNHPKLVQLTILTSCFYLYQSPYESLKNP